ncbi:hypothetical protein [Pelagibius sp.]|uniref:hypothetical protein n=1 Tax=Pelagibius sp. TaxID=1931238 RepID=UPI003B50C9C3
MASTEMTLQRLKSGFPVRFDHPRLMLALAIVACGVTAYALQASSRSGPASDPAGPGFAQWLQIRGFSGSVEAGGDAAPGTSGVAAAAPWQQQQICGRMQEIVEAACSFESADRDSEVYWGCVSRELKYTLWGAYGCS